MVKTRLPLKFVYLFLFVLLILLAIAVLDAISTLPPLNGHARERHAQDAERAWQYVQSLGAQAEHCRWHCPDGRDRYVCGLPHSDRFAVVVIEEGDLVTSFIASHDYAKKLIDDNDGCNPWRYSHP